MIFTSFIMEEDAPIANPNPNNNEHFVGYIKDEDYYFDGYSHFSIHE